MAKTCKLCKKRRSLSARGYCDECATRLSQNAIAQLRAKSGPIYEKWKANRLKAMKKLVDEEKPFIGIKGTPPGQDSDLPELPEYPE